MAAIFRANVCIEFPLGVPATLSEPNKKWHSAFAKIYCSRTLLSLAKNAAAPNNYNKVSRSPSYTVVNLEPPAENKSFQIDQISLDKILKEKNLDKLRHFGGIPGVVSALETDINGGTIGSQEDVARRQEAFGSNTYKKPPAKSFFHFVVETFKDLTILILLGCAALSLGFGIKVHGPKDGWYDGGSIFIVVFLVIAVSAVSNFRQNKQFDKLSKVSNNIKIEVIRKGRGQQISIFEIVVGDIICLKIGDQIPADGLFLEGNSLQVDESSITGESDHVEVNRSHNPFLFSGTKVVDGYACMLATSVGMNTTWGQMMSQISHDTSEETPLQARINELTSSIRKVALAVAFLVLVVLLVRYFIAIGNTTDENGNREFNGRNTKTDNIVNAVLRIVASSVTIVVGAVPKGLSLAVTLTFAYSMKRMMFGQAMVRKLSACEMMASATIICMDKTGTLTLNQMKVTKFWLGKEHVIEGAATSISPWVVELIQQGVSLNTTGCVYKTSSGSEFEFSGSPTEKAILSWAVQELNMNMEELKQSCNILKVEVFNSQKKRSGVLMRKNVDNTIHVHWKGAAEMILAKCSSYYDASGIKKQMDDGEREIFGKIIQGMAASSLRCIAFAHKQVSEEEINDDLKKLDKDNLSLLGVVGIKDPCRPGVRSAVEDCQHAGVNVKMVTGDNVYTAKAIATECGILRLINQDLSSGLVVDGEEFRKYTHEERMDKVDRICVMAGSSPSDKLLMVKCLKEKEHVVVVFGDDAPTLKEADIGLSMGIQGTEVAKESSDVVILNDNFSSVATIIGWGRCVYTSIRIFIQFQLTVNIAALVINFVAAVSAGEVPLTAVQLLWVNLIMYTLGVLSMATKQPTRDLMGKPSVDLFTDIMWRSLLAQSMYQIVVLLTLQFRGESIFGLNEKVKDTMFFNIFVLCQVFNEINARKFDEESVYEWICKNKLFLGIIGIAIVVQVAMVEFLNKFANTERLNWGQWTACIGIAAVSWPIG
ncbi:hypothetical protein LWI29_015972 [Acer saccharum]|uniref:Calcium-transporting ATPase n=1 Tax=Acer saccharum TaxID=4024 RepID=A0AA39TSM1_ACESA|nr:hypothetical protein LWI29_015972 [Acer saccharum]